jgi:hypothetical protein
MANQDPQKGMGWQEREEEKRHPKECPRPKLEVCSSSKPGMLQENQVQDSKAA